MNGALEGIASLVSCVFVYRGTINISCGLAGIDGFLDHHLDWYWLAHPLALRAPDLQVCSVWRGVYHWRRLEVLHIGQQDKS